MSLCLRTVWTGGVIAGLVTMSATAAPPVFNNQNRAYGNSVVAGICYEISNGYVCRDLSVWEDYDVKGTYDYTQASTTVYRWLSDPSDGSWSNGWRYVSCPVDQKAITAHPNGVTLEVILDPEAPGCESYGYLESWDPVDGYQFEPWPFPAAMEIAGQWLDPFSYGQWTINQKGTTYDGWSGTTATSAMHCNQRWGDMMRSGGFSINNRSWAFEGPEGPAWSNFSTNSCNNRDMQR